MEGGRNKRVRETAKVMESDGNKEVKEREMERVVETKVEERERWSS
jgi:hypothetical protein